MTPRRVTNVLTNTTDLIHPMMAVKVLCVRRNIRPATFASTTTEYDLPRVKEGHRLEEVLNRYLNGKGE
jgi:hypothetical protein